MELTIFVPDPIEERLGHQSDPDEFIRQAVEKALDQDQRPSEPSDAEPSRWKQIVQRVENESTSLGDYYAQFKQDLHEALRD